MVSDLLKGVGQTLRRWIRTLNLFSLSGFIEHEMLIVNTE